ncbi:MAG: acetate kinase [Erysipelotrichaceae bacterium]|nr:acetate kinase [Erysipelotrichaceae bacterium]
MKKVISVNAGSSSLKFQLFDMPSEEVLTSGIAERVGMDMGVFTIKVNGEKITKNIPIANHKVAVELLLEALVEHKIVQSLNEIVGAGHRIVQGGSYFDRSMIVDDDVVQKVDELAELAPLHNHAHLTGYFAFKEALPQIQHVFVFDTAFHQTMEPEVYTYPLPYEWYTDYKVRRYGAHGTSHQYVAFKCAELMGKDIKDLKLITCHLGNGASISAVDGGKCVNTSMGFTPLAGIMMGTRCGDIDPAIVLYMMNKTGMNTADMDTALNKKSGMLGITGLSSDARDVDKAAKEGNERAILAQRIYANRTVNVIGGYFMQMGRADAIVFTAGLGENDAFIRKIICDGLKEGMGIDLNYVKNETVHSKEELISNATSKVQVWVIPTNEELVIARDTYHLLGLGND